MHPTRKTPALLLFPALLIGSVVLGSLAPHAQSAPQKIALINVADVLKASPDDAAVTALGQKRDADLKTLDDQIQPLLKQGSQISPADKDKLNQLIATAQSKSKEYDAQINAKIDPITRKANAAVAAAAKANGVAVVFNANTAQQSGIVVYADPTTDLTDAVKAVMTKK
ncbi:OmpH family outer membrane protein [Deinococcus rubellus]|uniref:OmpH family outer membrane protein n=1 Tax=Deinococcus rubellus TaxID=1889240 RepID=A0ABY5YF20_9DEIO|nr:OmpH family outer membrane protein [Deinococcus rubellus]UWX63689.1 OmpH family outer membrane protein [Deinococcus rubellus]